MFIENQGRNTEEGVTKKIDITLSFSLHICYKYVIDK